MCLVRESGVCFYNLVSQSDISTMKLQIPMQLFGSYIQTQQFSPGVSHSFFGLFNAQALTNSLK